LYRTRSSNQNIQKQLVFSSHWNNALVENLIPQGAMSLSIVASYERRPLAASGQFDQGKKLMNIKHRTFNIEHRIMYSVYFKIRVSEAIPSFEIRFSTFCGSAVRF